jgi:PAS domain S-box-containing protein
MPLRRLPYESILLFVACLSAGLLPGVTAGSPDFVRLVWPPVGIGLVAVYLHGRSLVPAFWLATFALLTVSKFAPVAATNSFGTVAGAAALASAYSVQLLLGDWLLRRAVGEATLLIDWHQIASFLVIVGPLHTVVAASAGVLLACTGGRIPWAAGHEFWLNWWREDLLGGLLFAPLTAVVLGQPRSLWGPRVKTVAGPLAVAVAMLAAGYALVEDYESRVVRAAFARDAEAAFREVTADVRPIEVAARRMERFSHADLIGAHDPVHPVAERIRNFSADVPSARSVITVVRSDPADRAVHNAVTSVTPPRASLPVGSDPASDPAWARLFDEAAWTKRPAVGEPGGTPSARLVRAVFPCWTAPGPVEGFVAFEFNLSDIFDRVGGHHGEGFSLGLADPDPPRGPTHRDAVVEFLGRSLTVRGTLTPQYEARHRPNYTPMAVLLGVGLVVALSVLLLLVSGQTVVVARQVELRTQELRSEVQSRADVESFLRLSEQWLTEAQRITRLGYWEWKADTDELLWSAVMIELLGLQGSDVRLRLADFLDRVHPTDRDAVRRLIVGMPGVAHPVDVEFRVVRQDGTVRWFSSTVAASVGRESGVIRGTALDITDRKRTEIALREGEARLRLTLHSARMGTWEWVIGTGDVYWDLRQEAMFGFAPGSFNRTLDAFRRRVHPDDRDAVFGLFEGFPDEASSYATEFRIVLPDGDVRWIAGYGQVLDAEGRRPRLVGVNFDITDRKRADLVIQESELRHRLALDAGQMGTLVWDFRTERISWDGRLYDLFGVAPTDFDGTVAGFFRHVHPDDREALTAHLGKSRCNPLGGKCQCEFRTPTPDGKSRWLSGSGRIVPGDEPGHLRMVAVFFDISEKKYAEVRLLASQERLHEAQEISRIGSFEWYPLTGDATWSEEQFRLFGYEANGATPSYEAFIARVHPDDVATVEARFRATLDDNAPYCYEFRVVLPDGEVRHLGVDARITRDAEGRVTLFRGTNQDITERKLESAERRRFREQLTETQRLESLGILAGGVAHDFNNLLTGILGNASLARGLLPQDSDMHEYLRPIEKSAEHAAQLCQQMLTYAGAGKTIHGTLDLDALIAESNDLIKLSASRKADWRVELHRSLPTIEGDAGQIRQVLLNLVQNASEALPPGGGQVVIRTGHADPYPPVPTDDTTTFGTPPEHAAVWLDVSDTGCGMTAANRQHIFEPFFTTKFTGRGLGLSAVHGIVRDHNGCISVTSRPGHGTTFRVAFPCSTRETTRDRPPVSGRTPVPVGWNATVRRTALVADDEPAILGLVGFALKGLGFALENAAGGTEAIALFLEDPHRFDVAVIDLIMPGNDGREVLKVIRSHRPEMPVILMSGYTEHQLSDLEFGDALAFLHKPFRAVDLTGAVRRSLDHAASQSVPGADGSPA